MADKNFLTDIIDADLAEGKISEIHTRFPDVYKRQASSLTGSRSIPEPLPLAVTVPEGQPRFRFTSV